MQIDWWTLALQTINFVVLVWLLQRFLYRPVRELIEKRRRLAEQAFAEASEAKDATEAARLRLEEREAGLANERQEMLKKIHAELEAERGKVLDEAKARAEEMREAASAAVAEERGAALAGIRDQVAELATELAADLLRKVGLSGSNAVFLDQLEQRLAELPADERARLEKDLAPDAARLTAVTAAPLTAEEQGQWADRLGASLGQRDKIGFAAEPEILGGVELRFPHAVIKFTWADQLNKARESLREK